MKKMIALFFAVSMMSAFASAADTKMNEPSAEDRQKMAEMHQKMADCLKSDKPIAQCHEEMEQACKDMGANCPMMGMHHGKGMGMHHHGKKAPKPADKTEEKK